jgi:hypothetical protein
MWKIWLNQTGDRWQYGACALQVGYLGLQTHAQNRYYLPIFQCNNGCKNASQCYVTRTLHFVKLCCFYLSGKPPPQHWGHTVAHFHERTANCLTKLHVVQNKQFYQRQTRLIVLWVLWLERERERERERQTERQTDRDRERKKQRENACGCN